MPGVRLKTTLRQQHALWAPRVYAQALHAGDITNDMGLAYDCRTQAKLAQVVTHRWRLYRKGNEIPG